MNNIINAILEDTPDAKVYVNGYTVRVWLAWGQDEQPRMTLRASRSVVGSLLFAGYGEAWVKTLAHAVIAEEPEEMILDYCRDHGFDR